MPQNTIVGNERQRRYRRTPPEVLRFIEDQARLNRASAATEIRRIAIDEYGDVAVPGERTVRELVNEARGAAGTPWRLEDRECDASVVLEVLRAVVEVSNGSVRGFDVDEARLITAIHGVAEKMDAVAKYLWAMRYKQRRALNEPTEDLDVALALRLWDPDVPHSVAKQAAERGLVSLALVKERIARTERGSLYYSSDHENYFAAPTPHSGSNWRTSRPGEDGPNG